MHAPAPPPVACPAARPAEVRALDLRVRRAGLPAAERAALRSGLRLLVRGVRARGGDAVVRGEACAVLDSAARVVRAVPLSPGRARLLAVEARANAEAVRARRLPAPRERVDRRGIVLQRYAGLGLRVMPLAAWSTAGAVARGGALDDAARRVDRLLALATPDRRGALRIEYAFSWASMRVPWTSGIADGSAIEALIDLAAGLDERGGPGDAARAVGYRRAAVAVARDLVRIGVPGPETGLEATTWYPLYAPLPSHRILNGHLEAVYALARLADAVDEPWIAEAHARGLAAALRDLPAYDLGTWSAYSPGVDAPLEYHDLQTLLLRRLANLTGDDRLRAFERRFRADRDEPPELDAQALAIERDADGTARTMVVRLVATKPADLDVAVAHAMRPAERLGRVHVGVAQARILRVPLADGEELVDLRLRGSDVTGLPIAVDLPVTTWDDGDGDDPAPAARVRPGGADGVAAIAAG